MFRFLAPAATDSAKLLECAPVVADSSDFWSGLGAAEPWAAAEYFDHAFPVVDRCLRRLLRFERARYDSFSAMALQLALSILFNGLAKDPSQEASSRERLLVLAATVSATHVALVHLRTVPGSTRPKAMPPNADVNRRHLRASLRQLQWSLARMRECDAELLILADVFGYEMRELSPVLGCRERRLQRRLQRARCKLSRCRWREWATP